jgi:hypothetical protein
MSSTRAGNEIAASLADSLLAMTDGVACRPEGNCPYASGRRQGILGRLRPVLRSRGLWMNHKGSTQRSGDTAEWEGARNTQGLLQILTGLGSETRIKPCGPVY